jgi:hypothetical protein
MNTINMPGFTAEVSLYRSSQSYHSATSFGQPMSDPSFLLLAMPIAGERGGNSCIDTCNANYAACSYGCAVEAGGSGLGDDCKKGCRETWENCIRNCGLIGGWSSLRM